MADRRRRRKETGDSDDVTESSEDETVEEKPKENIDLPDPIPDKVVTGESEYESAEEEDEDEDGEYVNRQDEENDVENPVDEEGGQEETAEVLEDDDIDGGGEWKDEQREEGDGEESEAENSKEKSLDFDEDRRNPQYIPKKGGFYEHDDRLSEVIAAEEEEKVQEETAEKKKNLKKLWKDEGKWIHDRFHETEQTPKSTGELVGIYGYDIRNEDGPPHARRRRRYGRGPSKYTRKWEDEDAYNNGLASRGKDNENFRGGNFRGRRGSRGRPSKPRHFENDDNGETKFNQEEFPRLESKTSESTVSRNTFEEKLDDFPNIEESNQKRRENNVDRNKSFGDGTYKKRGSNDVHAGRGQRRPIRGRNRFGRNTWPKQSASAEGDFGITQNNQQEDIADEMKNLSVNEDDDAKNNSTAQNKERRQGKKTATNQNVINSSTYERRQASIPPRLQDAAANKPKRYSSQRQRSATESGNFIQQNQSSSNSTIPPRFYDQCYQQSVYPDRANSSRNPPANTIVASQSYQGYEPPYQESFGIRPIAANTPRMFSPVSLSPGQPVISASYVASGANLMSYSPQNAYPQYPFQPYASTTTTAPVGEPHDNTLSAMHSSPPQEIFRGGMAYYNTQPPVRSVPKRLRAAIPIVPPPEMEENERSSNEDLTEEMELRDTNENVEEAAEGN